MMWQGAALVWGLVCVTGLTSASAQVMVDTSCNGLQITQQQSRLDRVASEIPPEQRARFEGAIQEFQRNFETLRQGAEQVENTYRGVYSKHLEAAAQAHPDIVSRLGESVLRDNPSLAARLGRNDQNAQAEYQQALIAKLNADPRFSRDLNRRLEGDPEARRGIQQLLQVQNRMHQQEYDLAVTRLGMPLPATERQQLEQRAANDYLGALSISVEQKGALRSAIEQSQALRDLIVTQAAGGRAKLGSLADQKYEGAASNTGLGFDREAKGTVAVAVNETRDLYGRTEATGLRATLDVSHIAQHYMPKPEERGTLMRDMERPLTVETAKTLGHALQKTTQVKDTWQRITREPPPPPPVVSGPLPANGLNNWMQKAAEQMKKKAEEVRKIYVLD